MTGDVAFRSLRPSAAILLLALSVSCDRDPSSPTAASKASRSTVEPVTYARVIEPDEPADLTPPAVAVWSMAGVADPLNSAFDVTNRRLWTISPGTSALMGMEEGPSGDVDVAAAKLFDARSFRLRDPRGLTVDPGTGQLFVLDAGPRILRLTPHPILGFRTPDISVIDLAEAGLSGARGIAFDPSTGHLHVLDPAAQLLHEISQSGEIVRTRDVSQLNLRDVRAMTFAPSRDNTDDPSEMGLFVSAGGKVMEVSFTVAAAVATTATGTLVRTTQTWQYSPAAPDPSGLAYAVHLGKLIIVDGEVEEMTIYGGANGWETSLSGMPSRSWTTTSFSMEPVGVAYNSVNRHLFISDDDARQIFEIDPGPDGLYRTSDDQVRSVDTRAYGGDDPEGLAYDAANRVLFIADGLGAEVYRITAGANGFFDGPPPAGDDQVTHFDTGVHGLLDPEGIAFDFDFGHLYVGGKPQDVLFHFSQTGVLLRTIDVSAANADGLAGLEYGPSSLNPSARALYIVDRGVDNDSDPGENDGRLYEFALPSLDGNTLPVVMITAPENGSMFGEDAVVTFTGTASDLEDGDLTAVLQWASNIDGVFGTGGSISTSALSLGRHIITASVADGGGGAGSATLDVEIFPQGLGAAQVRVSLGSDDVEESASGSLQLGSSDLELVFDGNNQLVGLRFPGIGVPRGATITQAYVQFQADETGSTSTSLTIQGHATDNASTFSSSSKVSTRARTAAAVTWTPPPWSSSQGGPDQQTPNLAPVIQEIVNRPGWNTGNALALIITGTGVRTAEAFEGLPAAAPMLRVEYSTLANTAPTATGVTISGTTQVGQLLTGNYTYNDDEGDLEGVSTYRWLKNGTPITGAVGRTYRPVTGDEGSMIAFEVRPIAGTGVPQGTAVRSLGVGPIAAPLVNTAPTATNVSISGTAQVGQVLTGNFTYNDLEGDAQGTSTYRWLRNSAPVSGATLRTYTLGTADEGALIAFEVTPVATSGTSPGSPTQSPAIGPVHAAGEGSVQIRIATGSDDAEESATGAVQTGSSDLELVFDGNDQLVGLRFTGVTVPRGATVSSAHVQFRTDEVTTAAASLTIQGQAADNAVTFSSSGKVSTRTRTTSAVAWAPPAWSTVGEIGTAQQTPNLASIIQEIINRPGWTSGNAMALIITGTGVRTAEAFEGIPSAAPMLTIEYSTLLNTPPTATNVSISGTPQVGRLLTGNYSYADGEGDLESTSTYRWLRNGVPIDGAVAQTYTPVRADEGAMVRFEVTPFASTGASPGSTAQSAAVQIMPAPTVSATQSTVTASPGSIMASAGLSTITVTVKDATGVPIPGITVALGATGDGNTLTQPSGVTNGSGQATGTLTSTVEGTKVISATANGTAITQTATVEVVPAPPPPPITHTVLTSGVDPTNLKVYATPSIAPAPNALITLAVLAHRTPAASPSPTISGGGMSSWTEVGTITFDVLGVPLKRLTVYRAMSATPGSGPITITFTAGQSHALWVVSQWEGVNTSGVNGEGAIVQSASLAADEVNGLTLNLAPFSHPNNAAYGVFGVRSYHPAVTPGSGFVEVADHGSVEGPPSALQAEWRLNDNTIDATWNNLRGAVLGFEIRAQ